MRGLLSYSYSVQRYSYSYSKRSPIPEPTFPHKRLGVYSLSIDYVAFSYPIAKSPCGTKQPRRTDDGRKSRSIVNPAPLPEAAGFFTSKCMAPCAAFASPPVALPDWNARFTDYPAAPRTPGLPDGLAPSEAKVHGLVSEPTSPVRGEPVGGSSGVGGAE